MCEAHEMKMAIIHVSVHHHNTLSVAQAMGTFIGAQLMTVDEAKKHGVADYQLLGLGSGIFFGSHHRALLRWARQPSSLPPRVFLFSTAGLPSLGWFWHRTLRNIVKKQGVEILGEACYPGWDTVGPLRWIGGIQRGRPNASDLQRAQRFAAFMAETACNR
jgi:flavodoxin